MNNIHDFIEMKSSYIDNNFKKLSTIARWHILISEIVSSIFIFAIVFIIRTILISFIDKSIVINIANAICIIAAIWFLSGIIFSPTIGYHRYCYKISDVSVECVSGVFLIEHEVVPVRRMQQINISEGFLQRRFKLADVEIVTAGGTVKLENIDRSEAKAIADTLKSMINSFVKEDKAKRTNYGN